MELFATSDLKAGGRRQEAGGRRQEAGGSKDCMVRLLTFCPLAGYFSRAALVTSL
ncbi:MAG: hypothetical protein F6K41_22620 [Symploca sp. SIO3E6]|nr:hypothetical protein [Caldora sp. SIO3E6]